MIANIPKNNLNEVINAAANHKLILEEEKAAKKSVFVQKTGVPAQNVPKSFTQQIIKTPNS